MREEGTLRDPLVRLNDPARERRLQAVAQLAELLREGELQKPRPLEEVNNHIHTCYSFSPYCPAGAVWSSYSAGLGTAGIMDHDSISGAEEFITAGRAIGLATTIGVECRCGFAGTALEGRRINNPDQLSNGYMALHGIPHTRIGEVTDYFRPYLQARHRRNRRMTERLNRLLPEGELRLDYDRDVLPLSKHQEQGSVTERHLLFALAHRTVARYGRGERLLSLLEGQLGLRLSGRVRGYLQDEANPYYEYDLLGALKSELVPAFYVEAREECPPIRECLAFCERIGAISAYAYLGDIEESVTGDKKSQRFEDSYLEELFEVLVGLGFRAVTYMPNRNTPGQLARVQALCRRHRLLEISGVDINSPRQSFTCPEIRRPQFRHLIQATWALIGHELAATRDPVRGLFGAWAQGQYPELEQRIAAFAIMGRELWQSP
jgi:hypothetical protein